jgi:hypothetical protein
MVVNHVKPGAPVGTIYISDSTGSRYTKSLNHVFIASTATEFSKILGLEGIYVANIVASE